MASTKRLFIAALPSEELRDELAAAQQRVAPLLSRPRPTSRRNLHLTLAFLGQCDEAQEELARQALGLLESRRPFDLSLGALGCFGGNHGGSTVWQGVEGDTDSLFDLRASLKSALEARGFRLGEETFVPHMTLFRSARPAQGEGALPLIEALSGLVGSQGEARWHVGSANLMWSHRPAKADQLTYDEIAHVSLTGPSEPPLPATQPRTLFIDADACPVTHEALACARKAGMPVIIVGNSTQNLERHIRRDDPRTSADARRGFWVDVLNVSGGADSADFAIVERLSPNDVVVTQDIGLAGMALGRGATAIGVRGHAYLRETIDASLFIRHEEKKARRQGGRTAGPAKFTDEDRRRFSASLAKLLET